MRFEEIKNLTQEGVNDPHIFKAVFMAGGPGSGKTYIARTLFKGTGLKELNIDKFWNLYHRKGLDKDLKKLHHKQKTQQNIFTRGRLGLIIDGTGRSLDRMRQAKEYLESIGYDTAMVFVNTDLETALHRADKRALTPGGSDEGRVVDSDFIRRAWKQAQQNLGHFQTIFAGNFFIVDNSEERPTVDFVERKMRAWLNQPPRSEIARKWIEQQHSLS